VKQFESQAAAKPTNSFTCRTSRQGSMIKNRSC